MQKAALIIFVRHPELGKVKTRLARSIGDEKALQVYQLLLQHTFEITNKVACYKYVHYAGDVVADDLWAAPGYRKRAQQGDGLGERMSAAFETLLAEGYEKVLIIGSDCYQLNTVIINQAIASLDQYDTVLGPTFDGGYYLLGMKQTIPQLFAGKAWSTDTVAQDTIRDLETLNLSCYLLPKLHDVDEAEDLEVSGIKL